MPTTREVDAARAERQRRAAAAPTAPPPSSASGRRAARADAAHALAMALRGPRWLCHVDGCPDPGPHPAESSEVAERTAVSHYDRRHMTPPPEDLEERRAAFKRAHPPA